MYSRICILFVTAASVIVNAFVTDNHTLNLSNDPISVLVNHIFGSKTEWSYLAEGMLKLSQSGAYDKYKAAAADSEDKSLNLTQLIVKYGHKFEEHIVTTEDGYILKLFRILRKGTKEGKGNPLLIIHGLLSSADDWVTGGANKSLPYLAADRGHDVWLGNVRGNQYSIKHTTLHTDSAQFWNFSWDEIGRHDLPAMIDYILKKTGHSQLRYVGHSQGTTSFFVMTSERPEYNQKVSLSVALAPVALMTHSISPLYRLMSPFSGFFNFVLSLLGIHSVQPDKLLIKYMSQKICGNTLLATLICSNIIFLFCGFDFTELDIENLPVVLTHTPSSSSIKQILHYNQGAVRDGFRKYDYGWFKNLELYGSMIPPEYALERVTAPVALFFSDNDWFASIKDVATLRSRLPNVIDYYRIPLDTFNHVDFLWAIHSKKLVYSRLLNMLDKH